MFLQGSRSTARRGGCEVPRIAHDHGVGNIVTQVAFRVGNHTQIWGGVIGALGLEEGNEGADFYAAFYNDHVSKQGSRQSFLRARQHLESRERSIESKRLCIFSAHI